jgi:hypothetical protein
MTEPDIDISARPSTIEAMMRYDGGPFRARQLSTRRDPSSIGDLLTYLSEEGYLEVVVDTQNTKYSWAEEVKDELENPTQGQEILGELMSDAKARWTKIYQDAIECYDREKLIEDLPEGLNIDESNSGQLKLFERRDHRLHSETLEYLEDIGIIDDTEKRNVKLDHIDIQMLENYFSQLE